ncbi:MAG: sulfite exporter TauE/SafE family protein [Lachnospiraceae bacterium]|nr:sulfite exporter TauE/SafE family protein [Lachnospiraceae bacterium]
MKMAIYGLIGLTALCAGVLQGVTGFGAGIVMMMVLPSFFPLNQAAGVSCAIAILLSLSMFLRYRGHIQVKKVIWPAVLYVAVSSLSIVFSTTVDQALMKKVFGVFLILLSVYYLFFDKKQEKELGLLVSILFIGISGACDGLFGIGGPLMVLYFLGQTHSKEEYLGSIQAVFLVNLIYGTIMRTANHILTLTHLPYIGVGMACILAGLLAANRIVDRLDGEKIKKITYVVIGLSGVMNLL